jgi:hypothetical protein
MSQGIDLLDLFQTATKALSAHQQELNQADTYNKNHGDNMVEIFDVITRAMKEKKNADAPTQLEYAAQLLRQKSNSGSANVYAQGLATASKQVTGKTITPDVALTLLQTLMNGGGQSTATPSTGSGDLGSLLGGLLGGEGKSEIDSADLLNAGLAFLQSKQEGSSNMESLAKAFVATTSMGESEHRAQSGQLVANAVLQMLTQATSKK